jgi:glycosyltransferase involved in cell wall biosynthesis
MKKKPTIAIIIPTKNEAHNLPLLLKSIFLSKTPPEEVIIVDNHSTDNTLKVAKKFFKNSLLPSSYSLLLKGPERSPQKNFGAKKANATHLLFLDADMEISSNLLDDLERLAKKGAKACIIPEKAVGHDFWGKAIALERNSYQNEKLLETPRFFEKKLFLDIGGFDAKLIAGEDWDIKQRLQRKKAKIFRSKQPIIHHEAVGFTGTLKRKWYYAKLINDYAKKNPTLFQKQSNFFQRLRPLIKNQNELLAHPVHTIAFLTIKFIIYLRWKYLNL